MRNKKLNASRQREYSKKNPEKIASNKLKTLYGITLDQKKSMYNSQEGLCGICRIPIEFTGKRGAVIDHCHNSNKVRSILCLKCNTGLGCFNDNTRLMLKAVEYLDKHGLEGVE